MSTVGVGLDLVEVSRVERLLRDKGEAVYAKLLTTDERAYVVGQPLPAQHLAVRIAAKEAVYKALQALPGSRGGSHPTLSPGAAARASGFEVAAAV